MIKFDKSENKVSYIVSVHYIRFFQIIFGEDCRGTFGELNFKFNFLSMDAKIFLREGVFNHLYTYYRENYLHKKGHLLFLYFRGSVIHQRRLLGVIFDNESKN